MLLIGIALGVALVALAFFQWLHRAMLNSNARFDRPGSIFLGNLRRFEQASIGLFPAAPARCYVSIGPMLNPKELAPHETFFFIRSIGKRGGVHRYAVELRLGGKWRDAVQRAEALMARVDPGFARTDKSHGQIILMSGDAGELTRLIGAADLFVTDVLGVSESATLHVQWHWAGYNGRLTAL